jgi:hypothetical protein
VVWEQYVPLESNLNIYGQQVEGGGVIWGSNFRINPYANEGTSPSVAALPTSPTNEKFLVAMQFLVGGNNDIFGITVEEDNSLNKQIWIAYDRTNPAIAGDEESGQYLIAYRNSTNLSDINIIVQAISHSGDLIGNISMFPGKTADYPAVASGSSGDFLTVWEDRFPTVFNYSGIYGHLWGNRLFMPLTIK